MNQHAIVASFLVAVGALAACYTGTGVDVTGRDPLQSGSGNPGAATGNAAAPAKSNVATDLPCEIAQLLSDRCVECHGSSPIGSPLMILSRAHLLAKSSTDPSLTVAELSVVRMRDAKRPMPPLGKPSSPNDATVLEAWVQAGMPEATCQTVIESSPKPNPYDTPTVCSSDTRWTRGNKGSQLMRPGGACNACHKKEGERAYAVAGTLYPTAHEPNDCNGTANAKIIITDANDREYTLVPNAAGNFMLKGIIATPYTARVESDTGVRAMSTPQTDGDCNRCHTETGVDKTPGRIMLP